MLRILGKYLAIFFTFVVAMALPKLVFLALYGGGASVNQYFAVLWHGLGMDMSMAAYLTALPTLVMLAEFYLPARRFRVFERIYYLFAALVIAVTSVVNIGLYGYWHFPLDMTPVFYFTSSPGLALASAPLWLSVLGCVAILLYAALVYCGFAFGARRIVLAGIRGGMPHVGVVFLAAFLFLPIRGGFTVSTMNISHAYFSSREVLNHAAVNPAFSLLYSACHQADFGSQYRYMDDSRATAELRRMFGTPSAALCDSLFNNDRPDIYLIILESFSSHLFPALGGEAVAVKLDSIAARGVLFTHVYASSFRTDRGIPAILSALPAQPSTSLMKFAEKASRLPSLASALKDVGYRTKYYYGGDANFTNMKAYLLAGGFDGIVSDEDFPLQGKASKWGAHDHLVFDRVLADIAADCEVAPLFAAIQTSSSHEPFDVPFHSRHALPELNAFAYADSCAAAFICRAQAVRPERPKLFILVPDHQGAYPKDFDCPEQKHRIPLIFVGSALAQTGRRIDAVASQTDIAATLLAQLGVDASQFVYSRDIMDSKTPKWAFFSNPSYICLSDSISTAHIDLASDSLVSGDDDAALRARAYLQKLYDYLDKL